MKNTEIMNIIRSVFPTTDEHGNEIRVNCTQSGNGYRVMLVRCVADGGLGCPSSGPIGYGVTVHGIEGEAHIRAKLEEYAKRI